MIPALLCGLAVLVLALPSEGTVLLERTGLRGAGWGDAATGGPVRRWPLRSAVLLGTPVPHLAAAALAGSVAGAAAGPVPGALTAAAALVVRRVVLARRLHADRELERRRAAEVCVALAGELRAGRPVVDALDAAADVATGPSRALLAEAAAAARLGGDVPVVLRRPTPSAVPEVLAGLAACWQVCARSGSGLAAAVERLADGCREREEQRRSVEAALAGPRATAGLLALLPLAGIGLAASLGADPLHVLLRTPAGLVCLVLGVGLDLLGLWWTRRIVARAAR